MKTVCENNQCTGCMACVDICPKDAISVVDNISAYNAVIDENVCVKCEACYKVCQKNNPLETKTPIEWYQGWAGSAEMRQVGTSGGVASAIERYFVENGGYVCSCFFCDGEFRFKITNKLSELKKFAGSKYVKSNPSGVYKEIRNILRENKKVLFIGLPCQVGALKNYIGFDLQKELYTIDLICHGTPSTYVLEKFLNQYDYSLYSINDIKFRSTNELYDDKEYKSIVTPGVTDEYSIAFLNSMICTESCYNCAYARKERVSDLTLGDSWGSKMPKSEQNKGISLMLCQTEKGMELLDKTDLYLDNVDINNAISNNKQLNAPAVKPDGRNDFFNALKSGKSFKSLVRQRFTNQYLRQSIKRFMLKMRILNNKSMSCYGIFIK